MMESSPSPLKTSQKEEEQDPSKRLSLAVRELDKLIHRANRLAHLSEPTLSPTQHFHVQKGRSPITCEEDL